MDSEGQERQPIQKPEFREENEGEHKEYKELVQKTREHALSLIEDREKFHWLVQHINRASHLDGIISSMIHIEGGQIQALKHLDNLKPGINWYRGGTLRKFGDNWGINKNYYTEEELNTLILDGSNGAIDNKRLAEHFMKNISRETPVLYTIPITGLITGLENRQIMVGTEHYYDLTVQKGNSEIKDYLAFCRNNLQVQRMV